MSKAFAVALSLTLAAGVAVHAQNVRKPVATLAAVSKDDAANVRTGPTGRARGGRAHQGLLRQLGRGLGVSPRQWTSPAPASVPTTTLGRHAATHAT